MDLIRPQLCWFAVFFVGLGVNCERFDSYSTESGGVVFGATIGKDSTIKLAIVNQGDEVVRFGDPNSYVGAFNYFFEFRNDSDKVEFKRRPSLIISMDPLTVHEVNKGEFVRLQFDLGDGTWCKPDVEIDEFSEFRIVYLPPTAGVRALTDKEMYRQMKTSRWIEFTQ